MKIKANAKINLCLDVVEKRIDGYHELDMIMMPLTLHDELEIDLASQDRFTCSDPNLQMDEHNTIVKAVHVMRSTYDVKEHFHIHVQKNIPAQAGLAGGSADGAAVMRAINELCKVHIPLSELALLGKQIGADVPFCVMNQCAVVKGIGEKITPFSLPQTFPILLVKPNQGVSTKEAFQMLDFTQCAHPHSEQVKQALLENDFKKVASLVANSLEYSAFQLVPEIQKIKDKLISLKLPIVLMSGSGSTVFAIDEDVHKLQEAARCFQREAGYFVDITEIMGQSLS